MTTMSVFLGLCSVIAAALFFLGWASPLIYWGSLVLGLGAVLSGLRARRDVRGKTGVALGVLGVVPGLLSVAWLRLVGAV